MADLNRAFTVDANGIALGDGTPGTIQAAIFNGSIDPSVTGQAAPVGSIFLRSDGVGFVKKDAADTDWVPFSTTDQNSGLLGLGDWRFSTNITPPPADKGFRFNDIDPASATKLYIDYDNQAGIDMTAFIQEITVGSVVYLQQFDDATIGLVAEVTGNTDQTTYAELDLGNVAVTGILVNNKTFIAVVAYSGSGLPDPGSSGIVVRTALNTTIARTIAEGTVRIEVTNGDGVAGNPTIDAREMRFANLLAFAAAHG